MKRAVAIIFLSVAVAIPRVALAYRPFDSTDAAVAAKGELELEVGPLGFLKAGPERVLVAPGMILNIGIARNWEAVLQGRQFIVVDPPAGEPRFRLVDTGLFLKGVAREGSLQEARGPSIAIELGPLLPTINGETGVGATAALIASQRWRPVTVHVNGAITLTRARNLDLFGGLIVEGPHDWALRPVAEVFLERDFGASSVLSALGGAIWQVKEGLSFDVGLRGGRVDNGNAFEVRVGLTLACSLWGAR
ncbi:MAG: hypothetical protein AUG04_05625 [Deltaproteobacteria bacterium 13_1_20CM_2_69_21]|nr:MAG: hypothetical protein AUG04_05625 [Deltaproteobacteria bacterium 13_1_20CM_2_69_21]